MVPNRGIHDCDHGSDCADDDGSDDSGEIMVMGIITDRCRLWWYS